jgi:8-hydroxy-5-deazaflavin:NADPH oxidoreductase
MRIAILGAGNVGGSLGRRWGHAGHDVRFGVRRPEAGADAVKGGTGQGEALPSRCAVVSPAEAVREANVVVLATPWGAVGDALREAGADSGALDARPLLDATNPLKAGFALDVGSGGESGAERVQALVPNAHVVKVFNTTGAENIRDPSYAGAATVMLYAGNDIGAKRVAHELASTLGFDPVDAGVLARARELEHLAALWIALANGATGAPALGRNIAFRLVRR